MQSNQKICTAGLLSMAMLLHAQAAGAAGASLADMAENAVFEICPAIQQIASEADRRKELKRRGLETRKTTGEMLVIRRPDSEGALAIWSGPGFSVQPDGRGVDDMSCIVSFGGQRRNEAVGRILSRLRTMDFSDMSDPDQMFKTYARRVKGKFDRVTIRLSGDARTSHLPLPEDTRTAFLSVHFVDRE